MIDQAQAALIRQKLLSLNGYTEELRPFLSVELPEYRTRPGYRRAAERLIQLVVECAIDCAERVLEAAGRPPAPTARAVYQEIEALGVVETEVANVFARRYVGLRNRIVHDYAEIDDGHVLSGGKRLLQDAPRFLRAVTAWLDSRSHPEEAPSRQK